MRSWRSWISIAVVGLSSPAVAEDRMFMFEFKLVDRKSGATYGPFPATNGACIRIEGRDLSFEVEKGRANFVAAKLSNFRLPSVELHRVNLGVALTYLEDCTRTTGDPGIDIEMDAELRRDAGQLLINLDVLDITVGQVLSYICRLHNLSLTITEEGVVFVRRRREGAVDSPGKRPSGAEGEGRDPVTQKERTRPSSE